MIKFESELTRAACNFIDPEPMSSTALFERDDDSVVNERDTLLNICKELVKINFDN